MAKVESRHIKVSDIGQLYAEITPDARSRFSPSFSGTEVICPQPRRATWAPFVFDKLNKFSPKSKSFHHCIENNKIEFWDFILAKDEFEVDSNNQQTFFPGSPPVRTNNPLINDAEFTKLNQLVASPLTNCLGFTPVMHDTVPPSRGTSPTIRVEGFSCGNPESSRAWLSSSLTLQTK